MFQKVGQPLVEASLNGFNSSLFAYGQTGSGKYVFTRFLSESYTLFYSNDFHNICFHPAYLNNYILIPTEIQLK